MHESISLALPFRAVAHSRLKYIRIFPRLPFEHKYSYESAIPIGLYFYVYCCIQRPRKLWFSLRFYAIGRFKAEFVEAGGASRADSICIVNAITWLTIAKYNYRLSKSVANMGHRHSQPTFRRTRTAHSASARAASIAITGIDPSGFGGEANRKDRKKSWTTGAVFPALHLRHNLADQNCP
jgi:hypothetical protein